jgi:hypothetical protein
MKNAMLLVSALVAVFIITQSCENNDLADFEPVEPETDEALIKEIDQTGYTFYANGETLTAASASPHGSFKLRFNQKAWDVLDSNEELPTGKSFPDGSVIVKEVYSGATLVLIAVMKKATKDPNAASGWLWAEYRPDRSVHYGISHKGDACVTCHSSGIHRDLVRTFDLH